MKKPDYIDAEMRELLDLLGRSLTPAAKRGIVSVTNWHAPYYSRERYSRI